MILKLAILQAEVTNPIIIDKICDIKDLYKSSFYNLGIELNFFDVQNAQYPANPYEYDAYLITGSKFHAYDDHIWIKNLKYYIRENKHKKFIGICFGCQVIAEALGGKVKKSNFGWNLGVKEVNLLVQETWSTPYRARLKTIFNHQDIIVKLPYKAKLLASSEHCPIQMYTINRNILAMQFHPEFTQQYQNELMLINRNISSTLIEQAKNSYEETSVDNHLVLEWIVNFLKENNPCLI